MKIKSFLARPYAAVVHKRVRRTMMNAVEDQRQWMEKLVKSAGSTVFGKDHYFKDIRSHKDYAQAVPVRDYEAFAPYIEAVKSGRSDVLWRGKPMYFAKTSGTTSGTKYIPISNDSIHNHIDTARNALLCYMAESGNAQFADGRMIFLSGAPTLERTGGIPTGRLSGIVNHFIPSYLKRNQLPSYETNCIEDWETKLGRIVEETLGQDMRLISGIPPWMQMYFDWLREKSGGKTIKELFPNLQVIVHGGVAFEPYRAKLLDTIGGHVDAIETFPASEGFFAFQDTLEEEGLLLNTDSGIFFEFVPAGEIFTENPKRVSLADVKVGENYALIVNSNAGLWGYNIGDTVRFVSLNPYRIIVTGRTKHFISAFGEHVIGEEVEAAMIEASKKHGAQVVEFSVAPQVTPPEGGLPYHEWFISFSQAPANMNVFAATLNETLRAKNTYYDDLQRGAILQPLKITVLQSGAFIEYMKSVGKLGGQNKVPRLSNDRKLAEALAAYAIA